MEKKEEKILIPIKQLLEKFQIDWMEEQFKIALKYVPKIDEDDTETHKSIEIRFKKNCDTLRKLLEIAAEQKEMDKKNENIGNFFFKSIEEESFKNSPTLNDKKEADSLRLDLDILAECDSPVSKFDTAGFRHYIIIKSENREAFLQELTQEYRKLLDSLLEEYNPDEEDED
jgi:hypothetical protein